MILPSISSRAQQIKKFIANRATTHGIQNRKNWITISMDNIANADGRARTLVRCLIVTIKTH